VNLFRFSENGFFAVRFFEVWVFLLLCNLGFEMFQAFNLLVLSCFHSFFLVSTFSYWAGVMVPGVLSMFPGFVSRRGVDRRCGLGQTM
jgi:hypothetical protein